MPRLPEHSEASESISPIRSISLALRLSSLLPPACLCHSPCLFKFLLSPSPSVRFPILLQYPHPSPISFSVSSGCWPLAPTSVFYPSARQGPFGRSVGL